MTNHIFTQQNGTFTGIDLTLSDPITFLDYNWKVHKDSDHFLAGT